MNKKQRKQLLEQFAYAQYMVADGCPRKDFQDHWEIEHLLEEYYQHLLSTNQIKPYEPEED